MLQTASHENNFSIKSIQKQLNQNERIYLANINIFEYISTDIKIQLAQMCTREREREKEREGVREPIFFLKSTHI